MSKNITCDANILGGTPVISGTRIPISRIIYLLKVGYPVDAIQQEYPQVSIEKLNDVLDEVAQSYGSQTV